jgi:hypothetical protein
MRNLLLLLICPIWCYTATAQPSKPTAGRLSDIHQISKFLGTYPCESGLLDSPALKSAFKRTLGADYREYLKHISLSGCGRLEMRDQYAFADVSQLHVGGYTSYIFVRPSDGTTYVFWLNSTVREKHWAFYGPKPIPEIVLHTVETELNEAWGHVAHFQIVGQNLEIVPNQH